MREPKDNELKWAVTLTWVLLILLLLAALVKTVVDIWQVWP